MSWAVASIPSVPEPSVLLRAFHLQLQTCLQALGPLTLAALAMFPRTPGAVSFPCFSQAVVLMLLFCHSHVVILMTLHLQAPDSVLCRFSWEAIATSVGITPPFPLFLPFCFWFTFQGAQSLTTTQRVAPTT